MCHMNSFETKCLCLFFAIASYANAGMREYDPKSNIIQTPNGYVDGLTGRYIDPNTGSFLATPPQAQASMPQMGYLSGGGDCYSGEYIQSITDGGKAFKTSDNKVWLVDDYDTYNSKNWQVGDDVVICADGVIINTDSESEKVQTELLD